MRYPYTLILPLGAALVAVVMVVVYGPRAAAWSSIAVAAALGLSAWTLAEYVLHRFVLHHVEPFRSWHLDHHRFPDVPMRIPLVYDVLLVTALVSIPAILVPNGAFAGGIVIGLLVGHAAQDAMHHRLHRGAGACGSWLVRRRRDHEFHHGIDEGRAFGTLTSLWDKIFGTHVRGGADR